MSVNDIPDADLLKRAVRNWRDHKVRKGIKHARWTAVMENFVLGSNYSRELCQRFDLDPDEMVSR